MPAAFTTAAFDAISRLTMVSKSADEIFIGSAPRSANFFASAGFVTALVISACSRSTMGLGVWRGTNEPIQNS